MTLVAQRTALRLRDRAGFALSATGADSARSELDEKIEDAITEYTERVRSDRPYEDTISPDELRRRYDK